MTSKVYVKSDGFKSKLQQFFVNCCFQFCADDAFFIITGTFPCKSKVFGKGVRKTVLNGVKLKQKKCGENRLKVHGSEVS
jgi:hypothetical protein